jgi:3-hydroxybutyryl-CoA dehydrogenase
VVLEEAVSSADFVVEAALEDLSVKQALFARVEAACRADTILASNTSVIPITQIMQGLRHRGRALGTHWWNPPFLVPLVEVIATEWTDPECLERVIALHAAIGKTPVLVKRDVAGFIGNRLQHALWREAVALVADGICDARTVDTVVKASFGRRLSVLGPLENADLVGTELTKAIHDIVLPSLDRSQAAHPFLDHLVRDGRLGMKSGEGFRTWTAEEQAALRSRVVSHLKQARLDDLATRSAR